MMPEKPFANRSRQLRRLLLYSVPLIPVFAGLYYAAYWLRFEGTLGPSELAAVSAAIGWVVLIKLVVFRALGVCQAWNRYATFHDMTVLVMASTLSALVMVLGAFLFLPGVRVPRSVLLMDWGGTIVVVGGLLALSRLVREHGVPFWTRKNAVPVVIVGANDSGESLLRAIHRNTTLKYRVVGFISENDRSLQTRVAGIPILGHLEQACELIDGHGCREVWITAGDLSGKKVRELVENAGRLNVRVKVLPSYEQLVTGKVAMRPRDVSIEDLLHRDPVELDLTQLHGWIDGRTLLVTGSAGSIGSEICRQLLPFSPKRLVLVDRSENGQFFIDRELRRLAPGQEIAVTIGDVTDGARMENIFREYRPDIVFHAAAHKHVPLMEANPGEGVKNIACATRRLADLADRTGVGSFVMISTDKAVNPTSVMGANKRVAELYVQALAKRSQCRFVTVRFGNVLDSAGSVVPVFREQIAAGGPVCVTHRDMVRYFMTIPEASQLVIQAGAMGKGAEIFVLDMGEPVKIVDLAADMIRLSGLRVGVDVEIEFTGIRPGEKLFEELHAEQERHVRTAHRKITIAQSEPSDYRTISAAIDRLAQSAERPRHVILDQLSSLVPTFTPHASGGVQPHRRAA